MTRNKNELKPELLKTSAAAKFLGFATVTLKVWRQQGKGPEYRKINNKCYYHINDLKKFLKGE